MQKRLIATILPLIGAFVFGAFIVPLGAVHDVHFDKVILDARKLDQRLRDAIGRAHSAEDPD